MATLDAQRTLPVDHPFRAGRPARRRARWPGRAPPWAGPPASSASMSRGGGSSSPWPSITRPCSSSPSINPIAAAVAALERIASLRDLPPLEAAARLAELLAIEPLGAQVLPPVPRTPSSASGSPCPSVHPAADRGALALLQLTRVLFLYFVQSKGWLDGRRDFLARAVDDCLVRRRPLHRDLLRPLFFGALNRPLPSAAPSRGAIRRDPVPQRRALRAARARAALEGRHPDAGVA